MNKRILKKMFVPLDWINKLVPKNNKILLYSNLGFRDNIRSFYDYLIKNEYYKKYDIVCSTDDYRECEHLNKIGTARFVSNEQGIVEFLNSKYVFYCFGKIPIKPTSGQTVVNFWHGMPLKRIGFLEEKNNKDKYDYFTDILATSEFFKPFMAKAFGCDVSKIVICGQPRTDDLFTNSNVKEYLDLKRYNKIVLWMPTFRVSSRLNENNATSNTSGLPIVSNKKDFLIINDVLKQYNALAFIKLHPMQNTTNIIQNQLSNIRFINDEYINNSKLTLYQFISMSDALITDYSSVYVDYLLLDKPIGFTIDDINQYKEARGFIVDNPLSIMPGEKIHNISELISFIQNVIENNDRYNLERRNVTKVFHKYIDDRNCERIATYCKL